MIARALLILSFFLPYAHGSYGQCDTTYVQGDMVHYTSDIMGGVYYIDGDLVIKPGVTIFVEGYENDSCGFLEIHAEQIRVEGSIDGDHAGYPGGQGGSAGTLASSITGDSLALTGCSNKDNTGRVSVEGGKGGQTGVGPGGGLGGNDGGDGAGPKQDCQSTNDEAGMIGSAGGGGAGAGGSYGGSGNNGLSGGDGSNTFVDTAVVVSSGFQVIKGSGGSGGVPAPEYGTLDSNHIHPGSGGSGAGGGGRSYDFGLPGGDGGDGGGAVRLIADDSLFINGTISVNGEMGGNGGDGSHGNRSPKCCSDACDDCGEATLSCGAGSGGGAGGGSGGGILIESNGYVELTGVLSAKGGDGGGAGASGDGIACYYNAGIGCGNDQTLISGDGQSGGTGGGGGGGRIKVFYQDCPGSVISPTVEKDGGYGPSGLADTGTFKVIDRNCVYTSLQKHKEPSYDVYPNPVKNKLFWRSSREVEDGYLRIVDMTGREVQRKDISGNGKMGAVDVTLLSPGTYILNMKTREGELRRKLIKE